VRRKRMASQLHVPLGARVAAHAVAIGLEYAEFAIDRAVPITEPRRPRRVISAAARAPSTDSAVIARMIGTGNRRILWERRSGGAAGWPI
jgi:hypothetical protein